MRFHSYNVSGKPATSAWGDVDASRGGVGVGDSTGAWGKFTLLMWKNWLLQWRHPLQTAVEVLAPVLFSLLLVLFRSLVDPEPHPNDIRYQPFSLTALPPSARRVPLNFTSSHIYNRHSANNSAYKYSQQEPKIRALAYSPPHPMLALAMAQLGKHLPLHIYELPSAVELERNLTVPEDSLNTVLAGIEFPDAYAKLAELPHHLEFALRFPGESRFAPWPWPIDETRASDWRTNQLFQPFSIAGPRNPDDQTGGWPPGYYSEGFLTLQHLVTTALVNVLRNSSKPALPKLQLCRFPYPAYISDPLLPALENFVSIIVMLSFVYTCISTVKVITTEKERQLKEAMKIMGLPGWLHWTAWFLKVLTFGIISILLTTIFITVQWYSNNDLAVFSYTSRSVIFILLLCFFMATITFCFMISTFFSKANTAATVAGLVWFLSYAPYLFCKKRYDFLGFAEKLLICLGHNSAMALGFQFLVRLEGNGDGGHMSNIWTPLQPDDDFTLGHVLIMLLVDMVLYMLIAAYVEQIFPGDYGVPQPWYYPVTKSYWIHSPNEVGPQHEAVNGGVAHPPSESFEAEPIHLAAGIQIHDLSKDFVSGGKKKTAVDGLSLNLYEGQITALLGHNGAGKTTTMSMLTGMFPPTRGTATVGGHDIRTDIQGVRASLGLCPQYNVLFDELTVREHLYFFSRLKGLKSSAIKAEIDRYIALLDLIPKANARSSTLSGGMQRKLSVGVALCGASKVVLFDEPTAGMDPSARRALWDLLQKEKKGRTLLLSTHFMDEADLLGDRIAIMSGGKLQCCGSSFFLKKRYGTGYNLIMDKRADCETLKVTALLRKYIPNLSVQSDVGSELSYLLAEEMVGKFEIMLQDLETHTDALGINSYGISLTTLEEVFMKVGRDVEDEEQPTVRNGTETLAPPVPTTSVDLNRSPFEVSNQVYLKGGALMVNQFRAMFTKKVLSTIRSWILLLIQNIIPIAFLIMAILVVRSWKLDQDLAELKITLASYRDSYTVVNTLDQTAATTKMAQTYQQLAEGQGSQLRDIKSKDFNDYILEQARYQLSTVRQKFIVGVSLSENNITAWFSNQPYHAAPLTLNLVHNVMLKRYLDDSYELAVSNKPLPFKIGTKMDALDEGTNMGFQVAFNVGFSMAFVSAFYILFNIRERVSKAKHLQFVSGVKVLTFWTASYLWDFITFLATSVLLLITLVAFDEPGFNTFSQIMRVFLILVLFGASMIPIMYLGSFLFEVPSTGFTRMALVNIFTGVAIFVVVEVMINFKLNFGPELESIFLLVPHFCLSSGLRSVHTIASRALMCKEACATTPWSLDECLATLCTNSHSCCPDAMSENYYSWARPGIGRHIFFMILVGTLLAVVLLCVEWRLLEMLWYLVCARWSSPPVLDEQEEMDDDVRAEKLKIHAASEDELNKYNLVLRDLTKTYANKLVAVNRLTVGVQRFECFGLLGINGAGKTTTFKMLTGDVRMSAGDAWVNGLSLKTRMKDVQQVIGYCPQFDALIADLTGRETLHMFCLLRGMRAREAAKVAVYLASELDFRRHIDKQVRHYSGGNKRKLSTAVALVADPAVIYLDEPTTGMDPATKRHLWNVVCAVRDSGRCVVLTSHSMEECEALCTRLAIMVNGTFRCLGSVQHLKNKFSSGYTLTVKTARSTRAGGGDVDPAAVATLTDYVTATFPEAVLRETHDQLLTFYIATCTLPWSAMFGAMELAKNTLAVIEDYSLGQSSLEQVFLTFTKKQREEDS